MALFTRKRKSSGTASDKTLTANRGSRPTALRVFTILLYLVAVVFLILVEIGNISNKPVIRDTWFFRISMANVIPESVPNAVFINSIARTIGLHDFYQVGLWDFCEGYDNEGITDCSNPKLLYWFNPVEILLNELLAGASIALPQEAIDALDLVKLASRWMFAFFLAGACLSFLCIFFAPMGFSSKPRWSHRRKRIFLRQLPITILTLLAALCTIAATVIATVMFIIFKNALSSQTAVNIEGRLGTQMFAFMWIAAGATLIGFLMQIGTCCGICCCSGKRKAERKGELDSTRTAEKEEVPVVAAR